MQSSNPVLQQKSFQGLFADGERMTMNGTIGKTALLLVLAVLSAGWTWQRFTAAAAGGDIAAAVAGIQPFLWGGLVAGLVLALVTVFAKRYAGITAPLYALAEGFFLGAVSVVLEMRYPNIVFQAVMLTAGVMAAMLLAYRSGLIKVTDKFRTGVIAATGAIALLYLVDIGLRAFTSVQVPFIHESGLLGIGFSVLVVGLAALT